MQQKYISSELDSRSLALAEELEDVPTLTPIIHYVCLMYVCLGTWAQRLSRMSSSSRHSGSALYW